MLELKTYRWLEHCGPNWDDQLGYREKGELKKWLKRCPIKLYENYLVGQYKFNDKDFKSLRTNVEEKVNVAFTKVKKSDFPKENELFENIYA